MKSLERVFIQLHRKNVFHASDVCLSLSRYLNVFDVLESKELSLPCVDNILELQLFLFNVYVVQKNGSSS